MSVAEAGATNRLVLVVEDDAMVRATIAEVLTSLGYQVLGAAGPEEAMARLHAEPDIAILFSDVLMNDERDGIDLAAAARRLRPGIGVLLSSGSPPAAADAERVAGAAFLAKPYRLAELVALLDRLS